MLADDPRPAYQNDPERSYGMPFGEKDIHFRVDGDILRVYNVTEFVKNSRNLRQIVENNHFRIFL